MTSDDISWQAVGWGLILGGGVLLVVGVLIEATTLSGAGAGIAFGGLVMLVAYALEQRRGARRRD